MTCSRLLAIALSLLLLPGIVVFTSGALAAETRIVEEKGGFSYVPPEGWTISEFSGLKYKISTGSSKHGVGPNINIVDENFDGSLDQYAEAILSNMQALSGNYKKIDQTSFTTKSGIKGIRLTTEVIQVGKHLRLTYYIFKGIKDKKYTITCSSMAEDGEKLAPVFDRSISTFALNK